LLRDIQRESLEGFPRELYHKKLLKVKRRKKK